MRTDQSETRGRGFRLSASEGTSPILPTVKAALPHQRRFARREQRKVWIEHSRAVWGPCPRATGPKST